MHANMKAISCKTGGWQNAMAHIITSYVLYDIGRFWLQAMRKGQAFLPDPLRIWCARSDSNARPLGSQWHFLNIGI